MRIARLFALMFSLTAVAGCPGGSELDPIDGGDALGSSLPPIRDGGLSPAPGDGGPPPGGDGGAPPPGGDGGAPAPDGGVDTDSGTPPNPGDAGAGEGDAGPEPLFIAGPGEPCYPAGGTACDDGLVCSRIFENGAGTCAYPCATQGASCVTGGTCTDLGAEGMPELVCATQVSPGESCNVEKLVVCAGEGICLLNDRDPLGGTCRTPCTCAFGTSCAQATCGGETCVVVNRDTGDGWCGTAAPIGGTCSPLDQGIFCEGNAVDDAVCILEIDGEGSGTCRQRCAASADCDGLGNHDCFGTAPDGLCFPTANLPHGEVCRLDGTTLTCAAGLDCIDAREDLADGFGVCMRPCANHDQCADLGARCYNLDPQIAGAGARCVRELPRGTHGCSPHEPLCEGNFGVCVNLGENDSVCKLGCTLAECPSGACECGAGEICVSTYLASDTIGVCGTTVGLGEPCHEGRDVYCAPAPGEDQQGNAFAVCVDRCVYICHLEPEGQPPQDFACPSGLTCMPDPTGRLRPAVQICVDAEERG